MKNRLQFVHHDEVFATREAAIQYVKDIQAIERPALYAEPMVLKYESGDIAKGPNIILAIGSEGEAQDSLNNRTFFIDITAAETAIEDIEEEIAEIVKALTIVAKDTNTLDLSAEKTPNGTIISGDVKLADNKVIHNIQRPNTIQALDNGLYHYVNLTYNQNEGKLIFQVNETIEENTIPVLKKGEYVYTGDDAETIVLTMNDGSTIKIPVGKLVNEWAVMPADANNTPIILNREEVRAGETPHGIEEWQDVLSADIRLHEGDGNIIYKADGSRTLYAMVSLDYSEVENKLVFKWTENGAIQTKNIELNSIKAIEYIKYDAETEEIVIGYKTSPSSETQEVRIPVGDIIQEWQVMNEGHNVILTRERSVSGTDIVFGDVRIADTSVAPNNIIEKVGGNNAIYVRGAADNIKFGTSDVDTELKRLASEDARIENKFDGEIQTSRDKEAELSAKIGTGFSTDVHDNITAKFNSLTNKTDNLDSALNNEISRATATEQANANAITTEVTRATAAEQANASAISEERTRALGEEEIISKTIGTGFTSNQYENITYRFNQLSTLATGTATGLNDEIARATAAEANNSTAIANEASRATTAEQANANAIAAEETRANAEETTIKNTIGTGFSTDSHETVTYKVNELSGKTINTINDLASEVTRAKAAEQANANAIANESSRAIAAEQANANAITAEVTRATNAEGVLDGKIGTGFTNDPHDNVTYKFENLTSNVNTISGKVQHNTEDISQNRGDLRALESVVAEISSSTLGKVDSVTALEHSGIVVDNADDTNPKVGVQLRPNDDNIIKYTIDGLNATVNLSYDKTKNELTLHTSAGDSVIKLEVATIVKQAYYDKNTEEIVIVFETNTPDGRQTVKIPVGDLIREWDVDNRGHNVTLTRIIHDSGSTGVDLLSAELNISDDSDNMITVDYNGFVKVSNSSITALSASLDNEIARASGAEATLHSEVVAEQNSRVTADNNLQSNIDAEATARANADNALQSNITAEANRASNKESELNTKIETETARATGAEFDLAAQILATNKKIGANFDEHDTVRDAINAATAATAAEAARAKGVESTISGIAVDNASDITALRNDMTASTNNLQGQINSVSSKVGAGFSGTDMTNVIGSLSATTTQNTTAISSEIHNRELADSELNRKVTLVENQIESLTTGLTAERTRAEGREGEISSNLNDEVARAMNAETTLTSALSSASGTLASNITNEKTAREAADANINDRLNTLTTSSNSKVASVNAGQGITVGGTATAPIVSVKNSSASGNIIEINDGVYANVDMDYDGTTNVLKFKINGNLVHEFKLSSVSLVTRIEYDSTNKAIKIYYKDGAGQTAVTSIPVEDMVQEWTINNTGKSVELTRTTDTNIVSADLKIASGNDNMITKDSGGYVKVSNAPIVELSGKVNTISGVVTSDHTKVETLTSDMALAKANISTISGTCSTVSTGLTQLAVSTTDRFAAVNERIDTLSATAGDSSEAISKVASSVGLDALYEYHPTGYFISAATTMEQAIQILDQKLWDIYYQYISGDAQRQ